MTARLAAGSRRRSPLEVASFVIILATLTVSVAIQGSDLSKFAAGTRHDAGISAGYLAYLIVFGVTWCVGVSWALVRLRRLARGARMAGAEVWEPVAAGSRRVVSPRQTILAILGFWFIAASSTLLPIAIGLTRAGALGGQGEVGRGLAGGLILFGGSAALCVCALVFVVQALLVALARPRS